MLQPLDVGVFGPLTKEVSTRLDQLLRTGVNRLEKVEWVETYIEAREVALTVDNIQGGWRGAGLVPLNRARVTNSIPAVMMRITIPLQLPLAIHPSITSLTLVYYLMEGFCVPQMSFYMKKHARMS